MVNASPSSSRALTTASGYSRRSRSWSSSGDRTPSATSLSAIATKGVSSRGFTTRVVDMTPLPCARTRPASSPPRKGLQNRYPRRAVGLGPGVNRARPASASRRPPSSPGLGFELAALDRQLGRAQVTELDQGRLVVALLPARLEEDLLGLADESQDDHEAGAAALDRIRPWPRSRGAAGARPPRRGSGEAPC